MTVTVPRESIEQLEATITATVDPTDGAVSWAVVAAGTRPTTWTAATWDGAASTVGGMFSAVTVSPSVGVTGSGADLELTAGTRYEMFVRVVDASEAAVRSVGLLVLS